MSDDSHTLRLILAEAKEQTRLLKNIETAIYSVEQAVADS